MKKSIKFRRVNAPRSTVNPLFVEGFGAHWFHSYYVYNQGEMYLLIIILHTKDKEVIEYNSLYKSRKIKKIIKFEFRVNKIVEEFNNYIFQNSKQPIKKS